MTSNQNEAKRACLAVVLAAGEGKRMKSDRPKVLHAIAGRSMLAHVLLTVSGAGADAIAVIVGPGRQDVATEALACSAGVKIFVQEDRRGTAHAVLRAREEILRGFDHIIVAFADTPLVRPDIFLRLRDELARGASVAALGFRARNPDGYGRFLMEDGELAGIREDRDANAHERAIDICNAGLMALDGRHALAILDAIGQANAQGEFYLTDAVAIARARGLRTAAVIAPEDEVMGVNDRAQLAQAEAAMQERLRARAMRDGATMIDPSSVYLSADTQIGRDVTIEPGVFMGPGVSIGDGAIIRAFSHLEGATIARGASIGPFARLRPGAIIGERAKIGNFVEIKAADIGAGAAVSHLAYLGDAKVGAKANIGAGAITCNYDGYAKHLTQIGAGAFIGSNSSLVAPVKIGDGAYVGSGSVVTKDVEADALAVARGRQIDKPGWAKTFRARLENAAKVRK